jgi:hypothetical protein
MKSFGNKELSELDMALGTPKYFIDTEGKTPGEQYYWFPNQGNSMNDNTARSIPAGSLVLGRLLTINTIQDIPQHRPAVFIIDYGGEQFCLLKCAAGIRNDGATEAIPAAPLLCLHSYNPTPGYDDLWLPFQYIKFVFVVERVRLPNGNEFVPAAEEETRKGNQLR